MEWVNRWSGLDCVEISEWFPVEEAFYVFFFRQYAQESGGYFAIQSFVRNLLLTDFLLGQESPTIFQM